MKFVYGDMGFFIVCCVIEIFYGVEIDFFKDGELGEIFVDVFSGVLLCGDLEGDGIGLIDVFNLVGLCKSKGEVCWII